MNSKDIDEIITKNYNKSSKTNSVHINDLNSEYLNSFELIFFSDGSCVGQTTKNKSKSNIKLNGGFGIYLYCHSNEKKYYKHHNTKIVKKMSNDKFIYNLLNYDIYYYNIIKQNNTNSILYCNNEQCNKYGLYNNENLDIYHCEEHKLSNSKVINNCILYDITNIRSEGFGILYSLIYIKILMIDKITNRNIINRKIEFDLQLLNIKDNIKQIDLKKDNKYKFMIVSDSLFWINVITVWMNSWIKNKKLLDYKNIDLLVYINYYMNILYENNINIIFKHIKGHSDKKVKAEDLNMYQRGNILADKLANYGNQLSNNDIKIIF